MSTYMKINGMEGNVSSKGFENMIQLSSVHFKINRHMNTKPGAIHDRQGTKPSVSEITVSKLVDKASPLLFRDAAVGKAMPTVEIYFANSSNDGEIYHQMTLSNVIVSGYEINHTDTVNDDTENKTSDNNKPLENITLNFTKIEVKNTPYDKNNNQQSPIAAGYDLETAQQA